MADDDLAAKEANATSYDTPPFPIIAPGAAFLAEKLRGVDLKDAAEVLASVDLDNAITRDLEGAQAAAQLGVFMDSPAQPPPPRVRRTPSPTTATHVTASLNLGKPTPTDPGGFNPVLQQIADSIDKAQTSLMALLPSVPDPYEWLYEFMEEHAEKDAEPIELFLNARVNLRTHLDADQHAKTAAAIMHHDPRLLERAAELDRLAGEHRRTFYTSFASWFGYRRALLAILHRTPVDITGFWGWAQRSVGATSSHTPLVPDFPEARIAAALIASTEPKPPSPKPRSDPTPSLELSDEVRRQLKEAMKKK